MAARKRQTVLSRTYFFFEKAFNSVDRNRQTSIRPGNHHVDAHQPAGTIHHWPTRMARSEMQANL